MAVPRGRPLARPVRSAGDGAHVLGRDPGLSQEPGRLRQAGRPAGRRRPDRRRRGRSGRPGGGQHLCLHRRGPPGVDRHRPGPQPGPGPGAQVVLTGCLAERYGQELAEALPEVDLVAGFGQSLAAVGVRPARAAPVEAATGRAVAVSISTKPAVGPTRAGLRPARAAPPAGGGAVGLPQGGRGVRPGLRVLRHPQLPGSSAEPPARRAGRRGRATGRPRDRPGGPGPGLLRP